MKLLLDTHIILWALTDDSKIPMEAKKLIEDESNDIYFSLASAWEVEIKHSLGKLPISGQNLYDNCVSAGYLPMNIKISHIKGLSSLRRSETAAKHNDPFDRILITQAKAEACALLTHDVLLKDYNEKSVMIV